MSERRRRVRRPKENHELSNEFEPRTENQREYVRAIVESDVTICCGPSGAGKTLISVGLSSQYILEGKIDNILVARSMVSCGNEMGAFPGGEASKIGPYMGPYYDYFTYFLGEARFRQLYGNKNIKFSPVEMIRGMTFKNTIMILEESQNCSSAQIKLFLTRLGENSKAIIIGDNKQSDTYHDGFQFCLDNLTNVKGLSIVHLDYSDILRHPIIPQILEVFDKNGI